MSCCLYGRTCEARKSVGASADARTRLARTECIAGEGVCWKGEEEGGDDRGGGGVALCEPQQRAQSGLLCRTFGPRLVYAARASFSREPRTVL